MRVSKRFLLGKPKELKNEKDFLRLVKNSSAFKNSKLKNYKGRFDDLPLKQKLTVKREFEKYVHKNEITEKKVVISKRGKKYRAESVPLYMTPFVENNRIAFFDDSGNREIHRTTFAFKSLQKLVKTKQTGWKRKAIVSGLPNASHYNIEIGRAGCLYEKLETIKDKKLLLAMLNNLLDRMSGYESSKIGEIQSITINSVS